jgi:bacterioferritin
MKSNPEIINILNELLADELTAVSQYMVHSEMCDNWSYVRLHKSVEQRAVDEMRHAETLIARILFLEGKSTVSKLNPIHIGNSVEEQLANDHESEAGAVANYNDAIQRVTQLNDHGTRDLLTKILTEEEAHIDWLEAQKDQIAQMGIQMYLSLQVKE